MAFGAARRNNELGGTHANSIGGLPNKGTTKESSAASTEPRHSRPERGVGSLYFAFMILAPLSPGELT